jgi:DNA gyrase subunit A
MGRAAKGRSIANLLELRAEERIQALVRVVAKYGPNKEDQTWQQTQELFFVTRIGTVKRTALSDFQNVRKGGIIAITLEQGDDLVEVCLTTGQNEIVLITKEGMSIRFAEEQVRSMGRNAAGVKGIELETDDCVVALALVDPDATLLVAGENGIGKRTSFEEYRAQSRGGKGIITMKTGDKTGKVVGALSVKDANELMLITVGGQMVRIPVRGIREAGRNTMGVKLIDLSEKDRLQAIAPVISETQEEEAVGGESTPAE